MLAGIPTAATLQFLNAQWNAVALGQSPSKPPSAVIPPPPPSDVIPPPYLMPSINKLKDIATLWKEYKEGLNGSPSIESLNNRPGSEGTAWRGGKNARMAWYRRNNILLEIEHYQKTYKITYEEAIARLEAMRGKQTLNGFSLWCVDVQQKRGDRKPSDSRKRKSPDVEDDGEEV